MTIKNLLQILVEKIKKIKLYQYLLLAILIHIILIIWFHYILIIAPKSHKTVLRGKLIRRPAPTQAKAQARTRKRIEKVPPVVRKLPAKHIPSPLKAKNRIAVKTSPKALPLPTMSKMADIKPKDINLARRGRGADGARLAKGGISSQALSGSGLYGLRYNREQALQVFGGTKESETAVIKALEWLKNNQLLDGSWKGPDKYAREERCAITSLALMCFFGYGETHNSPRYGTTVKKAIDYLLKHIKDDGTVGIYFGYTQGITTLALSEAYAMTKLPAIKKKLELALKCILDSQKVRKASPRHQGGWRYAFDDVQSDLSVTGWMAMAIKSCQIAGLDVPREAVERIVSYTKNMHTDRGFAYQVVFKNTHGMNPIGVLLLQYFGEGKSKEAKETLKELMTYTCDWKKEEKNYPLYHWYYVTLAMFNAGGKYWNHWNKQMQNTIIKNQQTDGHWDPIADTMEEEKFSGTLVLSTTFCCLMLEVYYRYMPIYTLGKSR